MLCHLKSYNEQLWKQQGGVHDLLPMPLDLRKHNLGLKIKTYLIKFKIFETDIAIL